MRTPPPSRGQAPNNANRLKTASYEGNLRGTYTYNGLEQLIVRVVTNLGAANGTIHYIHDRGGNIIAETNGTAATAAATLREYIWLPEAEIAPTIGSRTVVDMPVAVIDGVNLPTPATWMVHTDHLHRPVRMTNAAKAAVWQATWQPFGAPYQITGSAVLDARFPGQWFQLEAGLHYNWHRSYDASLGRYTQPDPLGFVDGPSVYGYARSSPGRYVDKDGRAIVCLAGPVGVTICTTIVVTQVVRWCIVQTVKTVITTVFTTENREEISVPPGATSETEIGTDPSTPTGRRGNPMEVAPGTNEPATIGGRDYSGHALDQMQGRGVPPSAVESTIKTGVPSSGSQPNTTIYRGDGVAVVTNAGGRVVTVFPIRR